MKRSLITVLFFLFPAITYGNTSFSSDFITYIKTCENGIRKGWNGSKWTPYHDGSGWHIAYGHLITSTEKENFKSGISESQAQELLNKDLQRAFQTAKTHFQTKGIDIRNLPARDIEKIVDFTFNGCLRSHPKMMNAIVTRNLSVQRKEYKRYARLNNARVEIKDRNQRFYSRYLRSE